MAVHDRPNHDAWDPLATLAAAATVTERVRLATTAVLLPAYDETLLARQAAVVDRVSGGRLDLGVGLGARADDYQALGRPFGGRGRRLEEQLQRLHELWAAAIDREATGGTPGPAPLQRPVRRCGSAATPTRPSAAPSRWATATSPARRAPGWARAAGIGARCPGRGERGGLAAEDGDSIPVDSASS